MAAPLSETLLQSQPMKTAQTLSMKPTYAQIAADYQLWMEYADPSGYDSEAQFNEKTIAEKIAFLKSCFGDENAADTTA